MTGSGRLSHKGLSGEPAGHQRLATIGPRTRHRQAEPNWVAGPAWAMSGATSFTGANSEAHSRKADRLRCLNGAELLPDEAQYTLATDPVVATMKRAT